MSPTLKIEDPQIDTGIEVSLIGDAIAAKANSSSKIDQWTASKVGAGRGYLSHILRMEITWAPEDERLPKTVILKLITPHAIDALQAQIEAKRKAGDGAEEEMEQLDTKNLAELAQRAECAFYNFTMDRVLNVSHPKCYYASVENPALIILEDLSGSHTIDFYDELNLKKAYQIAESIASLHAYSIQHTDWQHVRDLVVPGKQLIDSMAGTMIPQVSAACKLAKDTWPEYFDSLADRMPELSLATEKMRLLKTLNEEMGLPPVLVHGDLHVQNMTFDKDDHDKLTTIFDWQLVHSGTVVEDLNRLIWLSLAPETRRLFARAILQHYYIVLQKRLAPQPVPFGLETLQKAQDRLVPFYTALSVSLLLMFARGNAAVGGDDQDRKRKQTLTKTKCMIEDCFALIDAGKCD